MIKRNKNSLIALVIAIVALIASLIAFHEKPTSYNQFLIILNAFLIGWNACGIVYDEFARRVEWKITELKDKRKKY